MKKGFVALVGAGPGDVGLLTLRGKELLEAAEVVVYDRLVSEEIRKLIPAKAKQIDVGKESSNHLVKQDRINEILLEEAMLGNQVVRLKGGDPFLFGRGGEELELLYQNKISFEVVPGITSAISVPSFAGIPVTHRDFCSSVHIITGHQKENEPLHINFDMLSKSGGTLVFLMGVAALQQIADGLVAAGMEKTMPAAIVQNGTRPNQRKLIATLETIYERAMMEQIKSPAIIIVGKVCELSEEYDWFSKRPLFGTNIIVTRPVDAEGTLTKKLKLLGAEVFDFPCIRIDTIEQKDNLKETIHKISQFEWLAFTSKNGVNIFFDQLKLQRLDARILGTNKIAAIGNQTAKELEKYGIFADYVPDIFDGIHLAEGLCDRVSNHEKILILRARTGNEDLVRILGDNHKDYLDLAVYDTVVVEDSRDEITNLLQSPKKTYVTFTSASTVEGFMRSAEGIDSKNIVGICIGEQTAKVAEKYRIKYYVSESATIDSMVDKLLKIMKEEGAF